MADSDGLLTQLRDLWRSRRREINEKWDRTTPLADYVVDRWERAQELGWAEGASVYDSCLILGDVKVGKDTWIGPFTVLDGSGGLSIGSNCTVGAGSQIYTHDSMKRTVGGDQSIPIERAPVKIGNNVHISVKVVVMMGVTIGDGAVIGPNSLVNKDVPAGMTAYGTPIRFAEPKI